MIDPVKLQAVRRIVVHDHCADGLVSALLLHDALPEATIEFVQHNTPEHKSLVAESYMLFADFSPPADRVDEFVRFGAIVLDHHRTAKPVVDAFGEDGIFGDEISEPGVCGATLVYEHIWAPRRERYCGGDFRRKTFTFARLTGIRDTWQRNDPDWCKACLQQQILLFIPRDRWLSLSLANIVLGWEEHYDWLGEVLQQKQDDAVQKAIKGAYRFTAPGGVRVVTFNEMAQTSDATEALGVEADLVMGFRYITEGGVSKLLVSTRSHAGFDCAAFCKWLGGGGHTKAAGFSLAFDPGPEGRSGDDHNPYTMLENLVGRWAVAESKRERDAP